jgi:hypothetical protein
LAVAAPVGHPLAPFVVGEDGGHYDDKDEDDEENLHKKSVEPGKDTILR